MPVADDGAGFRVDLTSDDGETRLILHGEIDIGARDALRQAVRDALSVSHSLVIDLADVTFIDSTGLAAIARATQSGSAVSVLNPRKQVRRALEVSGVDKHIEIVGGDDHPSEGGLRG